MEYLWRNSTNEHKMIYSRKGRFCFFFSLFHQLRHSFIISRKTSASHRACAKKAANDVAQRRRDDTASDHITKGHSVAWAALPVSMRLCCLAALRSLHRAYHLSVVHACPLSLAGSFHSFDATSIAQWKSKIVRDFRHPYECSIKQIHVISNTKDTLELPLQGYKNVINCFWCSWTMQKRSIAGCILSGMLRKQKYLILAKIRVIPHKWVGAEANEFFVSCNGRFWRFTGGKSKNLQAADGGKGIAYAANELCGIALITVASLPDTGIDTLRSVPPTITEVRTR